MSKMGSMMIRDDGDDRSEGDVAEATGDVAGTAGDVPAGAAPRLEVLFQDEWFVAVHKPSGVLMHPTKIAPLGDETLLYTLRRQLRRRVFPVHRLDRGTSGVVVLALHSEAAGRLSELFHHRQVEKTYLTVIRGFMDPEGVIDRPLRTWPGEPERDARTEYRTLATVELPIPIHPHQTCRYSLLEVRPGTGRRQQIRRHFSGLSHPVIGDRSHGDSRHNRLFRERFDCPRLLLAAVRIAFPHPFTAAPVEVVCPLEPVFARVAHTLFPEAQPAPRET
jgi:tRNA pseudouridine65 synthase